MRITWNELTVSFDKQSAAALIEDWRWLLGDSMELLLISSIGDMFLSNVAGNIFWLDTGTGKLQEIASSVADFKQFIQQRECADKWFVPQLVGDLITSGVRLLPGQCYSYKVPPFLGGELAVDNFTPTDLSVHFSVLGQLYRQVKDLPAGTKISDIKIEGP